MNKPDTLRKAGVRGSFRVLAGSIAILSLVTALPMSIYVALRGQWDMWFVAFACFCAALGLAGVARTGELFVFRKRNEAHDTEDHCQRRWAHSVPLS